MRSSIYKIFASLERKETNQNSFFATALPFTKKHKIGISPEGFPVFFIECDDAMPSLDINLEFISVLFYRTCKLYENNKYSENIYTIVSLKTGNIDFQRYFLDIVCVVLEQLPFNPSHKQLKTEIQKLIDLFSQFNRPPRKSIQGLWAELLIIEQAKSPEYLIQSWHSSPDDRFDFNDGYDKIEVKSTSTVHRIHTFALEQLNPNKNTNLLIASIFVIQTGQGKNIFDMINSICKRTQDLQLQFRLNEIVAQTLGNDFDKVFDIYFDYQQALDTIAFFNSKDIPTISNDCIPEEISNIRLDCDLSNIKAIKNKFLDISQSALFRSL